jgi:hypothetical protein
MLAFCNSNNMIDWLFPYTIIFILAPIMSIIIEIIYCVNPQLKAFRPGVAAPLINEGVCQNIGVREGFLFQYIYSYLLNILVHLFNISNKLWTVFLAFEAFTLILYSIYVYSKRKPRKCQYLLTSLN